MRIPLSWLKEYVSLSLSPQALADRLTMAGLEVDRVEEIGADLREIIVVRVLETAPHPHADKLVLASVTDGQETFRLVCGAPNCRAGIKTAFAPVGASLKENGKPFTIKKAKIRGIESEGMLCSEQELGISENHEEIMELPDETPEGLSLAELYTDVLLDISLTPNLGHCMSVLGVVRELSALTGHPMRLPQIYLQESEEGIEESLQIEVADKSACPRYACRLIKSVQVGPSPDWLRRRLEKCGLRSVNNVVDVTNYVLMEMGHPLHVFDYDKLEGQRIVVRPAREGEEIQTLDGKKHTLDPNVLVIADRTRSIALAGIMGGVDAEICEKTRHVLLEAAYFEPMGIRRTSKRLGIQTEASKRFERGTDPNHLREVLDRAAMLLQEVAGGEISSGAIDWQGKTFPQLVVNCRLSRINQLIGVLLSRGEVEDIFKRLQWICHWDGSDAFAVHVPTYRGDVRGEIDLIEEVARLYGYENIPRQAAPHLASRLPSTPIYLFEQHIRSRLTGEGLQEFITCDLIGPSALQIVGEGNFSADAAVQVLNPSSIEHSILRTSLLPGLLQVVKYNIDRQNPNVAGFELGKIHFRAGDQYKEQSVAGLILTGKATLPHWDRMGCDCDFFDLKGIVENLLGELGVGEVQFRNLELPTFHSGRQASVFVGSLEVGSIGEIHPAIQRRLDVEQRLLFGEFNLKDLLQLAKPLDKMAPLALYPCSSRDWTVTLKDTLSFGELWSTIEKHRPPLLETVSLKGIYRGEQVESGHYNLTLHFVYRDPHATIEQETVEAAHHSLVAAVLQSIEDRHA